MNYLKRGMGLAVGLIFFCGIFLGNAVEAKNYNTQIKKTQKYIKTIDTKIKKLSKKLTAKNKKSITTLKKQRKTAVAQLRSLQKLAKVPVTVEEPTGDEEPVTTEPVEPVSEQPVQVSPAGGTTNSLAGTRIMAGFGGGAGIVNLGYTFPIGSRAGIRVEAGYGMGNQYSLMNAGVSAIIPFGAEYVGVRVGAANYSEAVTDVPGISGVLSQGAHVGAGIFGGLNILGLNTEIGYNTDLGLTAGAVFLF
ncbi:MAG: hypothetical protein WC890_06830 [Candidatus Margulisiibacteriota bacterium]